LQYYQDWGDGLQIEDSSENIKKNIKIVAVLIVVITRRKERGNDISDIRMDMDSSVDMVYMGIFHST